MDYVARGGLSTCWLFGLLGFVVQSEMFFFLNTKYIEGELGRPTVYMARFDMPNRLGRILMTRIIDGNKFTRGIYWRIFIYFDFGVREVYAHRKRVRYI